MGYASELTMGWVGGGVLSGEKKPRFGEFADFHGINTPVTTDAKFSLPCH